LTDPPIVSLLTDFGLKDPYVAEMKAVILSLCPDTRIVDISHLIEKFNVRMGAFVLASASPYFPKGTIHIAVVDPTVGTKRRALLVETEDAFYVGPDNGVLMLAAKKQKMRHVYSIVNKRYMLPIVSSTFHGRDIFAPTAAHLAKGVKPSDFGAEIRDYCVPEFAEPRLSKNELAGEVLHVDGFGNIITNISRSDLEGIGAAEGAKLKIRLGKKGVYVRFGCTYGEVKANAALALIGSHDFLEIAVNQGDAARQFNTKAGEPIFVGVSR
jgi:S-adenosylmethionine hydrolase